MHVERAHSSRRVGNHLWPREHGAYVQLLGPLLGALLFVTPRFWSVALAIAACSAFLAHEPLVLLLGRRGVRALAQHEGMARSRLALLSAVTVLLIVAAVLSEGTPLLLALIAPASLAATALVLTLSRRDEALPGQLLSAASLASFAVPVLVASNVALSRALLFAAGWLVVHGVATLIARAYVYRKREGHRAVVLAAAIASTVVAVLAVLYNVGMLPLAALIALAPFSVIALLLAARLVAPRTPKQLGWLLTGANLASFVALGLSLW